MIVIFLLQVWDISCLGNKVLFNILQIENEQLGFPRST